MDFFLICSSINSVIPTFGQVGYCAANNFIDSYAHYKNRRDGTFTVAINWDTWQEVGMAMKAAQIYGANNFNESQTILQNGILPVEGIEVLKRILNSAATQLTVLNQVVVSTFSLETRYHRQIKFDLSEIVSRPS